MKWIARVAFHPHPQYEGDMIMCDPVKGGLLPSVVRELVKWGLRIELVKDWKRV